MPPPTPAELDAIWRFIERKLDERLKPVEKRIEKHSGEYRETRVDLAKKMSESQHDIQDREMAFERFMRDVTARIEDKVDAALTTIPPAALGAEAAAVAGAKASVATSQKSDAIQVAADRADSQSLSAKKRAGLASGVAIVLGLIEIAKIVIPILGGHP